MSPPSKWGRRNTIILAASMVSQPPGLGVTGLRRRKRNGDSGAWCSIVDQLAQYFPHGLEYKVAYETTSFVKASIEDVVKTLLEAIALVFLVMYLFLKTSAPR